MVVHKAVRFVDVKKLLVIVSRTIHHLLQCFTDWTFQLLDVYANYQLFACLT